MQENRQTLDYIDTVSTHPGGNAVCQSQEHLVGLFSGYHVFFQGGRNAVSLGLLRGCQDRGVIDSVGIVVDLLTHFDSNESLHSIQRCVCEITDRANSGLLQLFSSRGAH